MAGFFPYLLKQGQQVFSGAYPGKKVAAKGYLRMLLENNNITDQSSVTGSINNASGHIRDLKFWYRTRTPQGTSVTQDNCAIDVLPVRKEGTIPATSFRKIGIHLDDSLIAKYEEEASRIFPLNGAGADFPQGGVTKELWEIVIDKAQAILSDVNNDLLAAQALAFGKNAVNGLNTAKTVNFPLNAAINNDLNTGMTMILNDMMTNEQNISDLVIVGSGLINNYLLQQPAKSAAQNGLNTALQDQPKFYYDPRTATAFGTNEFGLFDKNAVKLIVKNRFKGFKSGDRLTSWFGVIPLPITDSFGNTIVYPFDVQLKYTDCPTEITIGDDTVAIDRGWNLFLMTSYAQFNIPSDSYAAADALTGNNGTYRYLATNA